MLSNMKRRMSSVRSNFSQPDDKKAAVSPRALAKLLSVRQHDGDVEPFEVTPPRVRKIACAKQFSLSEAFHRVFTADKTAQLTQLLTSRLQMDLCPLTTVEQSDSKAVGKFLMNGYRFAY